MLNKIKIQMYQNLLLLHSEVVNQPTRGHHLKLFKRRARLDVRKYSFLHWVVDLWNDLPENVVTVLGVYTFENMLDRVRAQQDLKYDFNSAIKKSSICKS